MRKKVETYILPNIQNQIFKIDEIVDLKIRTYFVSISLSYLFICRSIRIITNKKQTKKYRDRNSRTIGFFYFLRCGNLNNSPSFYKLHTPPCLLIVFKNSK